MASAECTSYINMLSVSTPEGSLWRREDICCHVQHRLRKQSRVKTLVMGNIKDEPLLVKGRRDLAIGIHELGRQLEWLRTSKRARNQARKLYRFRLFCSKIDTAESFCIRSTALIVLLFAIVYVIRAVSIFLLPELFLECSATHPSVYSSNFSVWPSNSADESISGFNLRWMLLRGRHPCVPIYMECFTLHDTISLPYQGQY
nr:uncharacterized protein LOC129264686 isoform X1 [Lytechinus pictus]